MIEHIKKNLNFTPHDTKWIKFSARFICCGVSPSNKGYLTMYELSQGKEKTILDLPAINSYGLKCATTGGTGSSLQERYHIAFGDYNGGLTVCDLERCNSSESSKIFSVKAHDGIINSIDGIGGKVGYGAPEIVTGGRDGCVRLWDVRVKDPVLEIKPDEGTSYSRDCWAVSFGNSFNNDERCICAGFDNGDIKLFNLRTNKIQWEKNCKNGITSIEFDRKDIEMNKLLVTTLESKFHCYDVRTQHAKDGFACLYEKAHRSTVWMGKHLPQNRDIFVTCGGNAGINIYRYQYPSKRVGKHSEDSSPIGIAGKVELLNSRVISDQPIVSFDWSPDREGLCCLSCLDQTLRVYIMTKLDKY